MKLAAVFFLLVSTTVFAQAEKGNGGGVIECGVGTDSKVYVLDYFEARDLMPIHLDLGSNSLTVEQRVAFVIDRVRRLDPTRASILDKKFTEYQKRNFPLTLSGLNIIPDANVVIKLKDGCTLAQGARQLQHPSPFEAKYNIDPILWKKMDSIEQAGLILHEINYSVALEEGASDSDEVRKFVAAISSKEFESLSLLEYQAYVTSRFPFFYFKGAQFSSKDGNSGFLPNGNLIQGKATREGDLIEILPGIQYSTHPGAKAEFDPNGSVRTCEGCSLKVGATTIKDSFKKYDQGGKSLFLGGRVETSGPISTRIGDLECLPDANVIFSLDSASPIIMLRKCTKVKLSSSPAEVSLHGKKYDFGFLNKVQDVLVLFYANGMLSELNFSLRTDFVVQGRIQSVSVDLPKPQDQDVFKVWSPGGFVTGMAGNSKDFIIEAEYDDEGNLTSVSRHNGRYLYRWYSVK